MKKRKLKKKIIRFIIKSILFILASIICTFIMLLPFIICGLMMQHDWLTVLVFILDIVLVIKYVKEEF